MHQDTKKPETFVSGSFYALYKGATSYGRIRPLASAWATTSAQGTAGGMGSNTGVRSRRSWSASSAHLPARLSTQAHTRPPLWARQGLGGNRLILILVTPIGSGRVQAARPGTTSPRARSNGNSEFTPQIPSGSFQREVLKSCRSPRCACGLIVGPRGVFGGVEMTEVKSATGRARCGPPQEETPSLRRRRKGAGGT